MFPQERKFSPGFFAKIKALQVNIGGMGDLLKMSQVPLYSGWRVASIARYGVCLAVLGLFVTEWRLVTRKLPLYNLKYENNIDYDFLREQDKAAAEAAEEARAKAAAK